MKKMINKLLKFIWNMIDNRLLKPIGKRSLCYDCPMPERIETLKKALKLACWAIEQKTVVAKPKGKTLALYFYETAAKQINN